MTDPWCSSVPLVHLLAGRWTLPALAELAGGGRRFQELLDGLDGISHKVLTDTLRHAERHGLVTRQLDPDHIPTATLYQLTDLGRSLEVPLGELDRWVERNWRLVEDSLGRWDSRSNRIH